MGDRQGNVRFQVSCARSGAGTGTEPMKMLVQHRSPDQTNHRQCDGANNRSASHGGGGIGIGRSRSYGHM